MKKEIFSKIIDKDIILVLPSKGRFFMQILNPETFDSKVMGKITKNHKEYFNCKPRFYEAKQTRLQVIQIIKKFGSKRRRRDFDGKH